MMSHRHEDDEFQVFLRGEDELARALQALEQPRPPEALDRAILEAASKAAPGPQQAANDPVVPEAPEARRPAPGFLRRLRVPMGLAAGLAVAVLTTWQWRQLQSPAAGPGAPVVIAQADAPPITDDSVVMRSVPRPAPDGQSAGFDRAQPAQWLAAIERFLGEQKNDDALDEWIRFRSAYPQYPVPAALAARFDALKP